MHVYARARDCETPLDTLHVISDICELACVYVSVCVSGSFGPLTLRDMQPSTTGLQFP